MSDRARTAGYLVVPGLDLPDGSGPDPMPFDPAEWQTWYARMLAHRVRVMAETNRPGPEGKRARSYHRALCKQPDGLGHLYWLVTFCFLTEQRDQGDDVVLPFIPTPRQVELILTLHEVMAAPKGRMGSLAVEKCRAVGATWIDASHHVWEWTFSTYYTGLLVSEDAEKVDKPGDSGSWMWKLDFLLGRHLRPAGNRYPAWLLPTGFSWDRHKGHRTELKLLNPETGSSVIGEGANETAGRSTRVRKASMDEAAFFPYCGTVWNLLNATTDHRFIYSTAGMNPPDFYHIVHGKEGYIQPRTFRFEWHQWPGRDQAWLDAVREGMKLEDFEREYLIKYLAGTGVWVYPEAGELATGWWPYEPGLGPLFCTIDDGGDDPTALVVFQREAGTNWTRVVGAIEVQGWTIRQVGELITGEPESGRRLSPRERAWMKWATDVGLKRATFYGDRHGEQRNQVTMTSPFETLATEYHIHVIVPEHEENSFKARRDATKELIPWLRVHEANGGPQFLEALQLYKFPKRRSGSQATSENDAPVHDDATHLATCCDYFAVKQGVRRRHGPDRPLPPNIGSDDPALPMGRFARQPMTLQYLTEVA